MEGIKLPKAEAVAKLSKSPGSRMLPTTCCVKLGPNLLVGRVWRGDDNRSDQVGVLGPRSGRSPIWALEHKSVSEEGTSADCRWFLCRGRRGGSGRSCRVLGSALLNLARMPQGSSGSPPHHLQTRARRGLCQPCLGPLPTLIMRGRLARKE